MEPWGWGLFTIGITVFLCSGLWDILSERERDKINEYYWNKLDDYKEVP